MGYGPAGGGGSEPKPRLQRQIIHLVDHAVDIIPQFRTGQFNRSIMVDQLFGGITGLEKGVGGKPQGMQAGHRRRLARC